MKLLHHLSALVFLTFTCLSTQARFYKLSNADVAVGGTGQFTTSIADQTNTNYQATTDSAGFLLIFRAHPVSWAGIECGLSIQ